MSRRPTKRKPTQALTDERPRAIVDRPVSGAVHPVHGTIGVPIAVVGATGTIGREIARTLVASGRPVVAVAPDYERVEALRLAHPAGAVNAIAARIIDDRDAARLAAQLRALRRPLGGVVIAFPFGQMVRTAAGERSRLLDQTTDALRECLDQVLLPQFALARHLVPLLAESGRNSSYVIVGGPGSEVPWAGYGHRSVAMAATRMLAQVLHDEARPLDVRVHLLSIDSPIRGERPEAHECPEWPTASGIAKRVVQLVDRTQANEPVGSVVPCGRSVTRSIARVAQTFRDVPAFLDSLKTQGKPQ